jgi:basic membrane protein A
MSSRNYRIGVALLAFTALMLMLPACNMQDPTKVEAQRTGKLRVGIVFDIGGKDDRSFNAAAWTGVKCAETGKWADGTDCGKPPLGIILRDVEPGNPTSIEPAMRAFAERGYDLIIGVGFAQSEIMEKVAKDYPNINFAIVDGYLTSPNVALLSFEEQQGSYLVGMIAGRTTKTNTIGFIGGIKIPLIQKFQAGYIAGAKSVNPNINVLAGFVGSTDSAWNDPVKGKELTLAQISQGADVIFTAAGNSGLGAFDAVEQGGVDSSGRATHFVIGVDSNQDHLKPGFVLTSMVKRVESAVYQIIQDKVQGKFKGGDNRYGLANDGVGYSMDQYNDALVPKSVRDEVEAAKAKIIAKEIVVPTEMKP